MIGKATAVAATEKVRPRVREALDRMERVPVLSAIAARFPAPEPTAKRWFKKAMPYVATSGATLGLAYFLDRERGRERRSMARDRIAGLAGRTSRLVRRTGGPVVSDAAEIHERFDRADEAGTAEWVVNDLRRQRA